MAELLLVNPRRRRRRPKAKRRRRMSALQRQYFGGGRRRRRHRTATNARVVRAHRRRRRRHSMRAFRRRRSNPSLRGITSGLMPQLKAGFMGALGGLGLDVLMGQLAGQSWLPDMLKTGYGRYALKLAGAVGVGFLGNYVLRGRGRALTEGAMTVVLHDLLKEQVTQFAPSLPLGEYMTFAPTVGYGPGAAPVLQTGLGEYVTGPGTGTMGEYVTGAGDVAYDPSYYGGY